MTINGKKITAKKFAWEGCHKIYLINTKKDEKELLELGYDLYPIEKLRQTFEESCSLKFIANGDLDLPYVVNQFEEALFRNI